MRLVEDNDFEQARQLLEQLLADPASLDRSLRHIVALLHGQLSGSFVERQRPWLDRAVMDTVILTDDEHSAFHAIAAWQGDRFWPVLIDDGWFSRLFIDAFKPRRVVRYEARELEGGVDLASELTAAIRQHNGLLQRELDRVVPPGIVVLDSHESQRIGGYALALGRRQVAMVLALDETPVHTLEAEKAENLAGLIGNVMNQWRLLRLDQWCGLTLAGDYPYRYTPRRLPSLPGGKSLPDGPLAVDDLLGRDASTLRLAVSGRLIGSPAYALYQAMCSLFLEPKHALVADEYSNRDDENWGRYQLHRAADLLESRFIVRGLFGEQMTVNHFLAAIRPRHHYDLVWINSSGGPRQWDVSGLRRGRSEDMPLGYPTAIYMVHSFSTADPWDGTTIAGRSLAGGAYWYFGSMYEPMLAAFTAPTPMAQKFLAGTPLAMAARHVPGHPFYIPWRLMLIGDPLLSLRPQPAQRIDAVPPLAGAEMIQLLEPSLEAAEQLTSGQLRRAVVNAYVNGAYDQVAQIDPALLAGDSIVAPFSAVSLERVCLGRIEAGQIDAARATLVRRLVLGSPGQPLDDLLKAWLIAMAKAGRKDQALAFLREQAGNSQLPASSRKAIEPFLTDAP